MTGHNQAMRKILRRHLPRPEHLSQQRWFALFGASVLHPRLWLLNRHSVACGVAIGLFCGLIPGPLQMLAAAILCVLRRANLPVALLATLYTNPLTIVPLYLVAFAIGGFVTRSEAAFVRPPDIDWQAPAAALDAYWQWLLALGLPLLVGLPLLAGLLAGTGYLLTKVAWRAWLLHELRQRRARHESMH